MACCLALHVTAAVAADTISGTVRNQTTGQPAGDDEVILLRLGQGIQEEARTRTDAQGAFTLNVTEAKDLHAVRVLHQGVNYDQSVTGSTPLEITVFDAVAKIPGLSGAIGIAQMQSDGTVLKITEMYSITNASTPPVTQSGGRNFEISVPARAALDSLEARTEQGDWTKIAAAPVRGQTGRYTVNLPLRPGNTIYKFTYHVPYAGLTAFHLKPAYPVKSFAVTIPPSMSFKASRPGTFKLPGFANGVQINATTEPVVKEVPAFLVAGAGTAPPPPPPVESNTMLPPQVPAPSTAGQPQPRPGSAAPDQSPSQFPSQFNDQSKKEFWLLVSGIIGVLAAGVFFIWRIRRNVVRATAPAKKTGRQEPLLDALKEELFRLESDRLHGSISAEEYSAAKAALQQHIERAMK